MNITVAMLREVAGPLEWSAIIDRSRRSSHSWILTIEARSPHSGKVFATDIIAYRTLRERNEAIREWEAAHIKPYGETGLIVMDAYDLRGKERP